MGARESKPQKTMGSVGSSNFQTRKTIYSQIRVLQTEHTLGSQIALKLKTIYQLTLSDRNGFEIGL